MGLPARSHTHQALQAITLRSAPLIPTGHTHSLTHTPSPNRAEGSRQKAPPSAARLLPWERKPRLVASEPRVQRKPRGGGGLGAREAKGKRLGPRGGRRGEPRPSSPTPQRLQAQHRTSPGTKYPSAQYNPQSLSRIAGRTPASRVPHPRSHSPCTRLRPPGHPSLVPAMSPAPPTPVTRYAAFPTARAAHGDTEPRDTSPPGLHRLPRTPAEPPPSYTGPACSPPSLQVPHIQTSSHRTTQLPCPVLTQNRQPHTPHGATLDTAVTASCVPGTQLPGQTCAHPRPALGARVT